MALVSTIDGNHRKVIINVHAMRGAILTVIRYNHGGGKTKLTVALTPEECRELAASFNEAAGQKVK
jgi:hypothetical protein